MASSQKKERRKGYGQIINTWSDLQVTQSEGVMICIARFFLGEQWAGGKKERRRGGGRRGD